MKSLAQQLQEINTSTLHNMNFLLESYTSEVLNTIDTHILSQTHASTDLLANIHNEVSSIIQTLQDVETVIADYTQTKEPQ